ncbi:methionine adenosyltransferase [Coriobacteriia bacterium Es71-Z0120]|uniref:methionine adenosyltransferase n=1 Tax=Parvivirga hydrogeniphila TaxID=2939460 RepID=UPI002260CA24|nr:methionine adenosyltransferase [Parvivirga hydrogeniphila]MCL4079535.1 methionine adenosyltransferase [Parvivirga hydrogeniphila]
MPREYLFTSESVTEGHPDKMCDQISDAILDAIIEREQQLADEGYVTDKGSAASPDYVRVACETLVTTGLVVVAGEIRTHAYVDIPTIVRETVKDIGYTRAKYGFDYDTCGVVTSVHEQSPDIAIGVDEAYEAKHGDRDPLDLIGAGDQGMMFGYACTETSQLMPMPIYLAHRLAERLTAVRKAEVLPYLRPDGKTQVTVRYVDGRPVAVEKILISSQHADGVDIENLMRPDLIEHVIEPVFDLEGIEWRDAEIYVNPTGRFVIGGPMGDSGLTGRKIIVDTYGGMGRHGGGAFSGKDCTKVDRSAAYAARWVAKNVVAAGLAERCEIQIAYAIGVAHPLSVTIETFGTETMPVERIEKAVLEVFDLRPGAIIRDLDLRRPIYRKTAAYGHFGRDDAAFTWERTDRVDDLLAAVQ